MIHKIQFSGFTIEVTRKKMKNIYLRIYPDGKITLSVPKHIKQAEIDTFLSSKLNWIQEQQAKFQSQQRAISSNHIDVWGKRYALKVIEQDTRPKITLTHNEMHLQVRPKTSVELQQAMIDEWLRDELKRALPSLLEKWQPIMDVQVQKFFVQKMKTRWGSCNYTQGNVRFNSQLAKKSPQCLEYIVVHELAHLLEPSHNARFHSLMSQFLPNWKLIKAELKMMES